MERCSRTSRNAPPTRRTGKVLTVLACALALVACGDDVTKNYISEVPVPTLGSLNVNVTPATAAVTVTGPASFTQSFTGNRLLVDLEPGSYTVAATATGYVAASAQINVVAGHTSGISMALQQPGTAITTGQLNVNVTPPSATVLVTGPASFTQTFTGNQFIAGLAPGTYVVKATAAGFVESTSQINVVAAQTSSLSVALLATPLITEAPRAVYRDDQGNLIPLSASDLQTGHFVFYAWLKDLPLGIDPATVNLPTGGDPGAPRYEEQIESAPSFTQNLASAWVGFIDATGIVRPVIGADVRWEIDQWYAGRVNSTQFGTSDDNRVALNYGIFDDQADTRTNNGRLAVERYPLIGTDYPLFNQTGIATPFVDGFTWVTLFSPDATASSRIVAVATIDGEEIGKQILYKDFAPAPEIEIVKSVSVDVLNLDDADTVTWTVTVTNVGTGDATTVSLEDFLASGDGASYALAGLPIGSVPVGNDGFTYDFALPSAFAPIPDQNTQLLGNAWSFAVLANATVTNTGSSVVNGDVGVSAGSAVTGFPPGVVLNGTIHNNDAMAIAAQTSLTTAFTSLSARACDATNVALTGTFTPGVYCYDSSAAVSGPVVLDAQGDPSAEFVFRTVSTLTTPAGASVSLVNGASPCNVYWVVGSSATFGTGTFFAGNVLAQVSITANTSASLSGRALARTGTVTLDGNAITAPLACVATQGSTETLTFTATVTEPGTYCNEAVIVHYDSATNTWTPVDLGDDACFTAVRSDVSIIKDFVAADNTTSLGKSRTVTAGVPATLRVRVLNGGTGDATGVAVNDVLSSGAAAAYQLVSVSDGTPNATDGFDTAIGTLAAGDMTTLLFSVVASEDGTYCDTATVTADAGTTIGIGSDTACLTVATPNLEIAKTNAPGSVLPGATYASTIVVTNTGSAAARDVIVRDTLGLNTDAQVEAIYVSSSQAGAAGTLAFSVVTAPDQVDLQPGESMTFTVVSRIPASAVSGMYCDTATATSSNATTVDDTACVTVPAFSALQTQLVDLSDPVSAGDDVTFFSVLYVEALSNEGVGENVLTYSFGLVSPTVLGIPGVFEVTSTQVYLDSKPVRDPSTGLVVSDATSPTAELQVLGADYTVTTELGKQVLVMTPGVVLQPNTALYVVNVVHVPAGTTTNRLYTTSYIWESVGLVDPAHTYEASSSEPTTILP